MYLMKTTNKTLSKKALKWMKTHCTHGSTIELADGCKVCIVCETVLAVA